MGFICGVHDGDDRGRTFACWLEFNRYWVVYLRTRVKLGADGNIISANYAKIYDEIRFDARGTVSFWYYYNPTPNDRNLEFDPARNLFPQSMPGANIANP